jgi:membrane associated rhomboid family serine protease
VIPLRDINHATTRPFATYAILALNTAVFLYQLTLNAGAEQSFILDFGFVPLDFSTGDQLGALGNALTSMFMHGGLMHFAMNMWFLHVFGDNVEDALGTRRYVGFYVACGLVAAAAQYAIKPESPVPMVGASGAIAGVLGAYLKLFPHARVLTLIPIFIIITVRELPATLFLVLWFGFQLLQGVGSLGIPGQGGGVAFFAHIGGFVAGVLLVMLLGRRGGPRGGPRRSEPGGEDDRRWRKLSDGRGPYYQGRRGWDA